MPPPLEDSTSTALPFSSKVGRFQFPVAQTDNILSDSALKLQSISNASNSQTPPKAETIFSGTPLSNTFTQNSYPPPTVLVSNNTSILTNNTQFQSSPTNKVTSMPSGGM
jgi:hypothetical protein